MPRLLSLLGLPLLLCASASAFLGKSRGGGSTHDKAHTHAHTPNANATTYTHQLDSLLLLLRRLSSPVRSLAAAGHHPELGAGLCLHHVSQGDEREVGVG